MLLVGPAATGASANPLEVHPCPEGYKGVIVSVNGNEAYACVKLPPPESP